MKNAKQLNNLVKKAALLSFDIRGGILEDRVKKHIDHFKKLPLSQALPLMKGYLKELKNEIVKRTLNIESTVTLTPVQIADIKESLGYRFSVSKVQNTINPHLLGGIKVKIGDMVYNDSLASKIERLKGAI